MKISTFLINLFSAVALTPEASPIVYTVDTHTLSCAFTEILSQVTVAWTLGTTVSDIGTLDVNQGTITDKAQTSTLTLTSAQLVKMKAVGAQHTITCKITVGVSNTEFEDSHSATLWTPGVLPYVYRVRDYRGRVSNFNQSEARKHCFLASDWLKFETLPR